MSRDPYDGRPYYCEDCGLGYGEYLSCEEGDCMLESVAKAEARREKNNESRRLENIETRLKDVEKRLANIDRRRKKALSHAEMYGTTPAGKGRR